LCELITSNPERVDSIGVDLSALGGKPSLAGIEKFVGIMKEKTLEAVSATAERATDENKEDKEGDDDQKPPAVEPGNPSDDAAEEAKNVQGV
jgi:hypothetical protein